jgi:hypothetical protein
MSGAKLLGAYQHQQYALFLVLVDWISPILFMCQEHSDMCFGKGVTSWFNVSY